GYWLVRVYLDVERLARTQCVVSHQCVALPGGNAHTGLPDQHAAAKVADRHGSGRLVERVQGGNEGAVTRQRLAIGKGKVHRSARLPDDIGATRRIAQVGKVDGALGYNGDIRGDVEGNILSHTGITGYAQHIVDVDSRARAGTERNRLVERPFAAQQVIDCDMRKAADGGI